MVDKKENPSDSSSDNEQISSVSDTTTSPVTTDENTPIEENEGGSLILSSDPILGIQDGKDDA